MRLRSASRHNLKVVGCASVTANKINDLHDYEVELVVIEGNKNFFPLLGRNWLDILTPTWRETVVNKIELTEKQEEDKIN